MLCLLIKSEPSMSRIGKLPVSLPASVSAELLPGNVVKVKGPLGELSQKVDADITVTIEGNEIRFTRPTDLPRHRSMHGLYRALVHNMVGGVSEGYITVSASTSTEPQRGLVLLCSEATSRSMLRLSMTSRAQLS